MISITFDIYGAKLSTHFVLFLNVALNKTAIKNSRFNISGAISMSYLKSRLRCVFVTLRPSQIAGVFKSNINWNWFGCCYGYFYLIMTLKGLKWIEFFWQCMFQINLSCFQNLSNCSVISWSWRSSDAGKLRSSSCQILPISYLPPVTQSLQDASQENLHLLHASLFFVGIL